MTKKDLLAGATVLGTLLVGGGASAKTVEIGPADDAEAAIQGLTAGDELVLRGGTYTFTSRFGVSVKGTAAKPIVVRAKASERPVFYRADASQNLVDFDDVEYVTFRGIEFKGGSHGLRLIKARFVTVEDCEIHETDDVALSANSGGPYEGLQILRNHIHDTGGTGEGMYLGCNSNACRVTGSLIAGNHVHHTNGPTVIQGDGIELKEGSYDNVIRDNVIHDTKYPCILTYSVVGNGGPNIIERNVMWNCGDHAIQSAADAIIRNNIILSANADGIAMQPHQAGAPSNLVVVHNTILKAQNKAVSASGITGSVVIANNAVYAQSGSAISVSGSLTQLLVAGNVGVGGLSGTPSGLAAGNLANDFVSASYAGVPPQGPFPKVGSALLSAGVAAHVAADDFEGRARGGVADVGAYGYAAGAPGWVIAADFKPPAGSQGSDAGAPGRGDASAAPLANGGEGAASGEAHAAKGPQEEEGGCAIGGGSSRVAAMGGLMAMALWFVRRRRRSA